MSFFERFFSRTSPDRFARQVLGRLRAAGIRNAHYHSEQFAIEYRSHDDRDPTWMYLGNLYAECLRDPENRIDRIERFVGTFVSPPSMPATWEEAESLVRPVLRGASFGRGGPMVRRPVLRRPALPYLDELVVVDQPTSMGYVSEGMWDVPAERVFAAARANLESMPEPSPGEGYLAGAAVLSYFDAGDSYVVSRLLLDGWLASLADHVGGIPVAFAPDPTALVIAADEVEALGALFGAAIDEYSQAARPLSPMAYSVDGLGRLVPYAVGEHHALAPAVARARHALATVEYETQRTVMQSDNDEGYFVASCMMAKRGDQSTFTVATWAKDLPTLLPVVDYVAIEPDAPGDGSAPVFVPWQALFDEDLLVEAVEYRPTRYRIEQETRGDVLARLASRAVSP